MDTFLEQETIISIELSEMTRGTQKRILLTKNETRVQINDKEWKQKASVKGWQSLENLMSQLDVKNLHKLTVPSQKHASDAAFHTSLLIKTQSHEYASPTFDNTNPPNNLLPLLKAIKKNLPINVQKEFVY